MKLCTDFISRSLAALGAIVTLFALALDPFFAQVVNITSHGQPTGQGSIPRLIRYDPAILPQFQNGQLAPQQDQQMLTTAEPFFYGNGTQPVVFGNGVRADIPLSCPTSNCTWLPYASLGVCSRCVEMSEQLEFACHTTTVDWIDQLRGVTSLPLPNGTVCGYFLYPGGKPTLMTGYTLDQVSSARGNASAGEALLGRILPLVTTPRREPLFPNGSIYFGDIPHRIVDFVIASVGDGNPNSVYFNETPVAHECILAWCVKSFESSYYWAKYTEIITSSTFGYGPSFPWQYTGPPDFALYTVNVTIRDPKDGNNGQVYGLTTEEAVPVLQVFDDIAPSFTTITNSSVAPSFRFRTYLGVTSTRKLEYNPWVQSKYIPNHMDRLAQAMTNTIRSSRNPSMFEGTALDNVSLVEVRWDWLSLPLILLSLGLIFLAATVVKTAKEQDKVGVWKTSAIATLSNGLPDHVQTRLAGSVSVESSRARTKALRMKLMPRKGWRISGRLPTPRVTLMSRFSPAMPKRTGSQGRPKPGQDWV